VELVDLREGPRTFAEDYNSGGDRLAPGLTPNRLTPLAGSTSPSVVPDFPTLSNAGAHQGRLSPSPSVLSTSTSPSPKLHNIEDDDDVDDKTVNSMGAGFDACDTSCMFLAPSFFISCKSTSKKMSKKMNCF